jgi:hypothetical protein
VSISTVHLNDETAPPVGTSPSAYHAARVTGVAVAHFVVILILAIVPAVILALICLFALRSFGRPLVIAFGVGMLGWAILFASIPSLTRPRLAGPAGTDAKPSEEFKSRVEKTTKQIVESKKVPDSPALKLPPKPTGPITSDLERWNEVWREASAEAAALMPDYDRELKAAKFDRLTVPDRILADKDFTESRAIIEASQEAIRRARQKLTDLLTSVHKKVDDLHLGPEAAAEAQKSMGRTLDKMTDPMKELLEVEEKIVGHYAEAARYLDFIRPYWRVQDHKVMYQRQPDMDHVRSLTEQIKDGRNRQEELKKEMARFLATKIEEAKDRGDGK